MLATPVRTFAATPVPVPAEWMPHDVVVPLEHLPKRYSCDDLWYKFRDVLLEIGARPDIKILTWRCESPLGDIARSPRVHLQFQLPQALTGKAVRWSDVSAVTATVRLEPGHPASLDDGDCELLRQLKDGLLPDIGTRVTSFQLPCAAPLSGGQPHVRSKLRHARPRFDLEVQALTPVADAARRVASTGGVPQPPNSHPATFGEGFACNYGFRRSVSGCVALHVPAHAFLTSSGDDWQCERGFHRDADQCIRVALPPNGHLTDDSSGKGWACNPRYNDTGDACQPIVVPAHAYATVESGEQGWQCDRGYRLLDDSCVAVTIPAHAFLDDTGHEWRCERGFASANGACVVLDLPADSHLDLSGNAWVCNDGFELRGHQCVADKGDAGYTVASRGH